VENQEVRRALGVAHVFAGCWRNVGDKQPESLVYHAGGCVGDMKRNRIRRRVRKYLKRLPRVALEMLNPIELLGEVVSEPGSGFALLALVGAVAMVLFMAAAFFGIILDGFDRTPLQTLGLK
jgi:hypothetical protein